MRVAPGVVLVWALFIAGCGSRNIIPSPPLPIPYKTSESIALPTNQEHVAPDSDQALAIGDEVRITNRATGKVQAFTVVELSVKGFIGKHKNGKRYRVLYEDLAKLEVKRGEWHVFWL